MVSPEEPTWTFWMPLRGKDRASCCDLIIANQAALAMIESVSVLDCLRIGGHTPVVSRFRDTPATVDWRPGRPRLPKLLQQSHKQLEVDTDLATLSAAWRKSPNGEAAEQPPDGLGVDMYCKIITDALENVVTAAGGW